MSQEQSFDFIAWWNNQSFAGKDLFSVTENGELILLEHTNVKQRSIAHLAAENADTALSDLQARFAEVQSKVRELEVEWLAADDKQKLADKVAQLKEYLGHAEGVGDFETLAAVVRSWEHALYALSEASYAEKLRLAELAEGLADSGQWKETTQAFKDITEKWKQTGVADKHKSDRLWSRIEAARKTFHDRKRLHHTEEEKDMLQNMDLKIDLVEQAEAIAGSEDWKTTTDTFHRLTNEWKTIGHTVNKKNEELWQRFIAAKTAFFDKKREHTTKIQNELERNYLLKEELTHKAEELKDSTDWNVAAQAMAGLMEEWKKTGRIPQEKGDDLWKQFNGAQEHFFDAKKKHFDTLRAEYEQNYTLKNALLTRAEQIKNSNRWGETTAEMHHLFDEWRKVGPAGKANNKLWEAFSAARKHFFARKDANRDQHKQYVAQQKEEKIKYAKEAVTRLKSEIKEEEEKLADFRNAILNITPGKKAEELRIHLESLIASCEAAIKALHSKYEQALKIQQPDPQESNP